MDEKINEFVLKLYGKANLPSPLKLGNSFKVELDGAVDQVIDENNEDGTINRLYRFRPIMAKILYNNGEVTKTKDVRKRSQQLRAVLRREWQELNQPITEEDYYDAEMLKIIQDRIRNHGIMEA